MTDTREYVQKFANENGGDIFVEDVKLAEAGHQTTISDEEIVLKGTDGVMHKIDKSSFSEAVRGVLGPILYNLSKESGITKVLTMSGANANAADIGTTTLANLASALGVSSFIDGYIIYNRNIYIEELASNANSRFISCVFAMDGKKAYQIAFGAYYVKTNNNPEVYIRRKDGGTWHDWKTVQIV